MTIYSVYSEELLPITDVHLGGIRLHWSSSEGFGELDIVDVKDEVKIYDECLGHKDVLAILEFWYKFGKPSVPDEEIEEKSQFQYE